jgi:hypothetical protein
MAVKPPIKPSTTIAPRAATVATGFGWFGASQLGHRRAKYETGSPQLRH